MNKFKDNHNRWRTQSLFREKGYADEALYTMKEEDHKGLPSFRRLYLEISDPTEYKVANELLGGWAHLQALCGSKWFTEYIAELRLELEVKLRSEAIVQLHKIMVAGGKSTVPAARYFIDGEYKPKRKPGRPSKQEVAEAADVHAKISRRVANDMERLGLSVIEPEGDE